jgi:hypothetical protein
MYEEAKARSGPVDFVAALPETGLKFFSTPTIVIEIPDTERTGRC